MWTPARRTAIVGIGATEFSKDSGRTPMQLATEACLAACGDAGLDPTLVDGMSLFSMERNYEIEVARNLGIPRLRFFSMVNHGGGGGCATVGMAAMAVHTGAADYVLAYRAFNERSWHRFGGGVQAHHQSPEANDVSFSWTSPFGLLTPAQWSGMFATRYMHQHGATSEDFGRIAVVDRRHAANNPAAFFHGRPITLEEHQASRIISDPLRLLDCCQESDVGRGNFLPGSTGLPGRPTHSTGATATVPTTLGKSGQGQLSFGGIEVAVVVLVEFIGELDFRLVRPHPPRTSRAAAGPTRESRQQLFQAQHAILVLIEPGQDLRRLLDFFGGKLTILVRVQEPRNRVQWRREFSPAGQLPRLLRQEETGKRTERNEKEKPGHGKYSPGEKGQTQSPDKSLSGEPLNIQPPMISEVPLLCPQTSLPFAAGMKGNRAAGETMHTSPTKCLE